MSRAIIVLFDSLGIGAAPDAAKFGDEGSDTFGHIYEYFQKNGEYLDLPNLYKLGFLKAAEKSRGKKFLNAKQYDIKAAYGYASEQSRGKDTLSGHWEIMGVPVPFDWGYFSSPEKSFPEKIIKTLIEEGNITGVLGEKHASGTKIISELGLEHIKTKKPIVYTSADSVFQIAAHEEYFGLDRLYELCEIAFSLVQEYKIARVIARPFVGESPDNFSRTANRKDYAVSAPSDTLLDVASKNGRQVYAIGKISDIFAKRGISDTVKGKDLEDLLDKTIEGIKNLSDGGILFTNLVDFDSTYGHRRDVIGYGRALEYADSRIADIIRILKDDDLLVITADHGCDPTWQGTDHTRENIPILLYGKNIEPLYIGHRKTFSDIGQTIAKHLSLPKIKNGISCL